MTALTPATYGAAVASRLFACGLFVVAADFLFYGHDIGWTVGLFCFALLCASAFYAPAAIRHPHSWVLFAICVALCLMLVETVNWLAFALFWLFFAALFTDMRLAQAPLTWLRKVAAFVFNAAGGAAFSDGRTCSRHWKRTRGGGVLAMLFSGWFLPAAVGAVFLMLFASANPVIETWLLAFDWRIIDNLLTPPRMMFWFVAGVAIWGVLRASRIRIADRPIGMEPSPASPLIAFLFARDGVIRSLVIANALFLGQNLLDANFLWGGAALPQGITHAQYAHRGAYPLIMTALLAAAFILVTMRRGGGLDENRTIRALIYVWLLQNLVLVASSIWRTDLYVAQYSLTYLRLSALLWMGLVLVGLALIVAMMVLNKSSGWLIRANLIATLALLLAVCPVDLGRFIANYNVEHSRGTGAARLNPDYFDMPVLTDLAYLATIGPSALPALREANRQRNPMVTPIYSALLTRLKAECTDWRGWTYRAHRLCKEMAAVEGAE